MSFASETLALVLFLTFLPSKQQENVIKTCEAVDHSVCRFSFSVAFPVHFDNNASLIASTRTFVSFDSVMSTELLLISTELTSK